MVEKDIDIEAKANLQPPFGTREINSKCPRGYIPSIKKDKDNANQEHLAKALKDKAKSHNSSSTNQPQIQASKKHQKN